MRRAERGTDLVDDCGSQLIVGDRSAPTPVGPAMGKQPRLVRVETFRRSHMPVHVDDHPHSPSLAGVGLW